MVKYTNVCIFSVGWNIGTWIWAHHDLQSWAELRMRVTGDGMYVLRKCQITKKQSQHPQLSWISQIQPNCVFLVLITIGHLLVLTLVNDRPPDDYRQLISLSSWPQATIITLLVMSSPVLERWFLIIFFIKSLASCQSQEFILYRWKSF